MEFVQVKIRLYPDGRLDLEYGGRQVFAGQQIPGHQPQSNVRFGFGARTGGFFSAHDIDDLQLQVFLESLHEVTTPARNELSMRLLIHVDSNGKARLLREVIQMWQNGTYATDGEGRQVVATPGRFVLITDDALIGRYSGASLRDGQPVGRRLSTASYDWGDDRPHVEMTSEFATGNTLVSLLELGAKAPTNPFRHKFHPDHDNLDATFRNYREEAYPITRRVEVTLTETDPSGPAAPDHGYGAVAGTYRETITGLHKAPLVASGRFRLVRVSEAEELNP